MEAVSHSKLKDWKFCKQLYYYRHVEKLESRRKTKALYLGSILHDLLEFFAKGKDWKLALEKHEKKFKALFIEEREELGDIIGDSKRIMEGYVHKWQKKLNYVSVEEKLKGIDFVKGITLTIKPDGVIEDEGGLWLVEHKSTKKFSPDQISLFNPQGILYLWGLRQLKRNIRGIFWDYIRTKPPTIPPILKDGTVSKKKSIDTDYDTYYKALTEADCKVSDYTEILNQLRNKGEVFYRRKTLIVPESTIRFMINDLKQTALEISRLQHFPTRTIGTMTCRNCLYHNLCEAELGNLDVEFVKKKDFRVKKEVKNHEDKKERKKGQARNSQKS